MNTVDREIFAVKYIFLSLAVATKIWHAKIWYAMLYQLHGWASDENYLTDENFPIYGIFIVWDWFSDGVGLGKQLGG